ncbi:MAG: hypothetical protein ACRDD1_08790, partial [Planctomycetia bacterium]
MLRSIQKLFVLGLVALLGGAAVADDAPLVAPLFRTTDEPLRIPAFSRPTTPSHKAAPAPKPTPVESDVLPNEDDGYIFSFYGVDEPAAPAAETPSTPPRLKVAAPSPSVAPGPVVGVEHGLAVRRTAPAGLVRGRPFEYELVVQNVGTRDADEVVLTERLPAGVTLLATEPAAAPNEAASEHGVLRWVVGRLPARTERRVTVRAVAAMRGELAFK